MTAKAPEVVVKEGAFGLAGRVQIIQTSFRAGSEDPYDDAEDRLDQTGGPFFDVHYTDGRMPGFYTLKAAVEWAELALPRLVWTERNDAK